MFDPMVFRPGTRVLALPGWRNARLFCAADTMAERWNAAAFYPAQRYSARVYRVFLQVSALLRSGRICPESRKRIAVEEFLDGVLSDALPLAVRISPRGPVRKFTIQFVDLNGGVLAYLKCADSAMARTRLRRECDILRQLPPGFGPRVLKYGEIEGCDALLVAAVSGRQLNAALPLPNQVHAYTTALQTGQPCSLEAHPWLKQQADSCTDVQRYAERLDRRTWPVVFRHGDLAPWNLLRTPSGTLIAIDWEYGRRDGFPGLDVAQYVLQVAALIHRWSPIRARRYAIRELIGGLSLTEREASAIVSLAAIEAHRHGTEDGFAPELPLQVWRRAIWELDA